MIKWMSKFLAVGIALALVIPGGGSDTAPRIPGLFGMQTVSANQIFISENFEEYDEGQRYTGGNSFNASEKVITGGRQRIEMKGGSKALNIYIDYIDGAASHDSFMQSSNISAEENLYIAAKLIFDNPSSGQLALSFRDDNPNSSIGSLTIATITGGYINYLSDTAAPARESYSPGAVAVITAQINVQTGEIKIYNGDALKSHVADFRSINNAYYKNFNFGKVGMRIRANVTKENSFVNTYADDILIVSEAGVENNTFIEKPRLFKDMSNIGMSEVAVISNGDFAVKQNVYYGDQTVKPVMMICGIYEKEELLDVVVTRQSLLPLTLQTLETSFNVDAVNEDTEVRIFLWEGGNLNPMKIAASFVPGDILHPSTGEISGIIRERYPESAHPRIMLDADRVLELRDLCKNDPKVKSWYQKVKNTADTHLNQAPPTYDDVDPIRLQASGVMAARLPVLAFAYLIEQNTAYAEKAYTLMEAAAKFVDWGPGHFLDVATMLYGYAVAYDWCYDYYAKTPAKLALIEDAMAEKGLQMASDAYTKTLYTRNFWWVDGNTNWNIVCNGGVGVAALAMADVPRYEDLAVFVIESGLNSLENVLWRFAPDGAWYEGPGYWHYTVNYFSTYVASLQSVLGTDFGIMRNEGISNTAYYPIQNIGTSVTFNLNDASESSVNAPEYFFLAKQFNDSAVAGYRNYQLTTLNRAPSYKDILWYDEELVDENFDVTLAKDGYFRDSEVATFRNTYYGSNIHFAGLHGGVNRIEHGQLDVGTFVYETGGVRWAIDLGGDNYNLSQYWNMNDVAMSRWGYYRHRAEAHNTIVINPGPLADQDLYSDSKIIYFNSTQNMGTAIADTSSAYTKYVTDAKRGVRLNKLTGGFTVRDELVMKGQEDLYWFMHTKAAITLLDGGKSAVLSQGNKFIKVFCVGDGRFTIEQAKQFSTSPNPDTWPANMANLGTSGSPKYQDANTGIRKLSIYLPKAEGEVTICVYMAPIESGSGNTVVPEISKLDLWR